MNSSRAGHNSPRALDRVSLPGILLVALAFVLWLIEWRYWFAIRFWPLAYRVLVVGAGAVLLATGLFRLFRGATGQHVRRNVLNRSSVVLPREGLVYLVMMLVMATGAMLGRSNMLMLVFAMMAGPFVLNGWLVFAMLNGTRLNRHAPETVLAGEPFSVEIRLKNRKRLMSCRLLAVRDQIANARETVNGAVLFARVPPRSKRSGRYHLRLNQRGRYKLGPVHISSRFPMGLGERGKLIDLPGEIIVLPRLGRITEPFRQDNLVAAEMVERQRAQRGIFDDEMARIREYRSGDNPRAIHWRTSARMTELMVREFDQNRDDNLVVMLDLWQPLKKLSAEQALDVEWAISFAATACAEHMRSSRDSQVSFFLAADEAAQLSGSAGPELLQAILQQLAVAQPSAGADLPRLIADSDSARSTGTRAVLLTTRRDTAREQMALMSADTVSEASALRILDASQATLRQYLIFPEDESADTNGSTGPQTSSPAATEPSRREPANTTKKPTPREEVTRAT